jgi:membrane protease YdiL (CAAX protease family)
MRFVAFVFVAGIVWDRWHGILVYGLTWWSTEPFRYATLYAVRDTGYCIILFSAYRYVFGNRPIADLGVRRFPWWQAALGGAIGYAYSMLYPLAVHPLHLHATQATRYAAIMQHSMHGFTAALIFVAIAIVSPVAQEAFFRGALLTALPKVMPVPIAVLLSAVIFSLWHNTGGASQMLDTFVFGLIASVLFLRTRNLAAPLFMHVVTNAHAELFWLGVLR